MDSEDAPKVNLTKDAARITTSDRHYMKKIEALNLQRVDRLKKVRNNNRLVSGALGFGVFSIYFYTIYAVRQEKFFDDFNLPETTTDNPN